MAYEVPSYIVRPKQHFLAAYVDGSPEDSLLDASPERWHTVAAVMPRLVSAPPGLFETIDPFQPLADALLAQEVRLHKWNTSRPYKARLCQRLPVAAESVPFAIAATSFQERDARVLLCDTLDRFELSGLCESSVLGQKTRFRLGPFVKDGKRDQFLEVPENSLAVILLMADMLRGLTDALLADAPSYADMPPVLVVFTDLIAGDHPLSKWRTGFLQHILRRPPASCSVTVQVSPQEKPQLGDLLADNIAGLLTDTLARPSPQRTEAVVRLISALPAKALRWVWRTAHGAELLADDDPAPGVWLPRGPTAR